MEIKLNTLCVILIIGLIITAISGSAKAETTSNLEITNLSGASINFSHEDIQAMPTTTVYAELYCDGSLATYGNWTGILLSDLLLKAQLTPEVSSIQFTASDGYKVTIPIDLAMQPQTIIAYIKDGQPLSEGLRLILQGANGAAWISLITRVTMSTSGADYPPGVDIGSGKISDLVSAQSSPTPRILPPQQTSSPKNSSSNQIPSPKNFTDSNQPTSTPQLSSNIGTDIDSLLYGAVAIVLLSAAFATILTYKNKRKLQKAI